MSLLLQRLLKLKTIQLLTPPQLKTLVLTAMLKMMKSFLRSSTSWYHRMCSRTANSSALVILWRQLLRMHRGLITHSNKTPQVLPNKNNKLHHPCKKKMKTLRPSQLQLHRRRQRCAGFAKDQGLQSLSLKLKLLKTFRLHQPMKKKHQKLLLPRPTKKLFSRRT